jgi:Fe-S oxidoreductase/predicted DNA-binding transcriptional regulator YafY
MGRSMSRASRLQRIEELLLSAPNGLTIHEISKKLNVHRTTIWRDINEISREAPVQQNGTRYLIDKKNYLSSIRLSSGESLMLYIALRRLLQSKSHLPPMMIPAMEKLALTLKDPSALKLSESLQNMQHELPTDSDRKQIWDTLVQSWVEHITVRIKYQDFNRSVIEEVDVRPYHFEPAVLSEGVYLVAHCVEQDRIRIFNVERILEARLTTESFLRPGNVMIDSVLRDLWGIWYDDELTEVRLRFQDPLVARRVRKTVWLPSQKITDLPGGGIEWLAVVPDVFELVPWIRGWGPDCEVVSPAELQDHIQEAEQSFGGVTMTTMDVPRTVSFSDSFYASLHEVFDGERVRVCLQCSSCSGICPYGFMMDYPPRKMIAALRAGVFDSVMETDTVWMCVSCYACTEVCPASIPVTASLMTRTKEELLLAGNVPTELQDALENSQRYGNPLGESPRKRADWTKGLDPEVKIMARTKSPVDVLWFVGDYPSYHPRVRKAAIALAKVFHAIGIDFGILGPEEHSDGDSQRLAGERGLFEMLAEKNGSVFSKYDFNTIITTDPHAYNALKNEYPSLGIAYSVQHFTEYLADRLEVLEPLLKKEIDATVTYHDPCFLGRVNDIYDEPRALLHAIPGIELVEMTHSRENSLCCGGGGGGMWLDGFQWEKAHVRLSEWRVREAATASGADVAFSTVIPAKGKKKNRSATKAPEPRKAQILAVACPYEAPRFEDATKVVEGAGDLLVKDIAEMLVEAMGL